MRLATVDNKLLLHLHHHFFVAFIRFYQVWRGSVNYVPKLSHLVRSEISQTIIECVLIIDHVGRFIPTCAFDACWRLLEVIRDDARDFFSVLTRSPALRRQCTTVFHFGSFAFICSSLPLLLLLRCCNQFIIGFKASVGSHVCGWENERLISFSL